MSRTESQGSEPESNLYILYEASRLGGPFGIYEACCESNLQEGFSEPVEILAEFPCRGHLKSTLHHRLKIYAIQKDVPWFDTSLDDIFSQIGDMIDDMLQLERVCHFTAMDQD